MAPKSKAPPMLSRERLEQLLPPEAIAGLDEISDIDGESYVQWLETGEGDDPCDSSG